MCEIPAENPNFEWAEEGDTHSFGVSGPRASAYFAPPKIKGEFHFNESRPSLADYPSGSILELCHNLDGHETCMKVRIQWVNWNQLEFEEV